MLIGIAKGKKIYDKRENIKRKDIEKKLEKSLKGGWGDYSEIININHISDIAYKL